MLKTTEELIKQKMLNLLSYRARSRKELENKLKLKKYPEDAINKCLNDFEKVGLINDAEFAKIWVKNRLVSRPKGKRILQRELQLKGISKEIISEVLDNVFTDYSEYDLAKQLADKKWKTYSRLQPEKASRKLYSFLIGRGFGYEIVSKVIRDYKIKNM